MGTLSYWFPVHDPEFDAFSPGRLLIWMLIEGADHFGLQRIERGVGDSRAKRDFANLDRSYGKVNPADGSWRAAVARTLQSGRWAVGR